MKIRIKSIEHPGNYVSELTVLEVLEDCDIGKFLLSKTDQGTVIQSFWFPDKRVQEGDMIILHSGLGTNVSVHSQTGNVHHFFWNLRESVWGQNKNTPVLIEAINWNFQSIEALNISKAA